MLRRPRPLFGAVYNERPKMIEQLKEVGISLASGMIVLQYKATELEKKMEAKDIYMSHGF